MTALLALAVLTVTILTAILVPRLLLDGGTNEHAATLPRAGDAVVTAGDWSWTASDAKPDTASECYMRWKYAEWAGDQAQADYWHRRLNAAIAAHRARVDREIDRAAELERTMEDRGA